MKRFLFIIVISIASMQLRAAGVDEATARSIASQFLAPLTQRSVLKSGEEPELSYIATIKSSGNLRSSDNATTALFYIFNSSQAHRYVIVSGDDRALPVLGYSDSETFDPGNIPPNMASWLEAYKQEIQYAIDHKLNVPISVTTAWNNYASGTNKAASAVVSPLVKTKWNQLPYYNEMCPYNDREGERTITGCVATAMAQIMKYWNYPACGIGQHSYIPKKNAELGLISADFGSSTYDWNNMPVSVTSSNPAVAQLMYHCGISVNMNYGTIAQGGSSAPLFYANHPGSLLAFRKYFGYKYTNSFISKANFADSTWIKKIKAELDVKRPILYDGFNTDSGHAFVCDGYDTNDFFHFNWGWGGYYDGYFALDALSPGGSGFSEGQCAIIGIEPVTVNPISDLYMTDKTIIYPSDYLTKGQAFSIKANFKNCGGASFKGAFRALLYDANYQYLGVVGTSGAYNVTPGSNTGTITFSTSGISSMTASVYYIYFYTLPSGSTTASFIKTDIDKSGYLSNRLKIMVTDAATLKSDSCENNDTEANAFEIAPEFKNGSAYYKIRNVNLHNTSDIDYFKIKIPEGYLYSVSSFLYDSDTGADGGVYTLDGKYSYLREDSTWSDTEDYNIPTFDYKPRNGYLYLKVEPVSTGQMGIYALDFNLKQTKQLESSVNTVNESATAVYPSLNSGCFTLNLGSDHIGENDVMICNLTGMIVARFKLNNPSEFSKPISLNVSNGIYLVNITGIKRSTTLKIVITR